MPLIYTIFCLVISVLTWWLSLFIPVPSVKCISSFSWDPGAVCTEHIFNLCCLKNKIFFTWYSGKCIFCCCCCFFFFSFPSTGDRIGVLWAARQWILLLLSEFYSSGAHLQFASTSEISSGMWALPPLEGIPLIPCIVQMFLQVASMLKITLLILQNQHPLVILFSSFVNITHTPTTYCCFHIFTFTTSFQIAPSPRVSPGAASHFPKKRSDFYKRSLDGYTTAQDFTAPFFQTFKPFFTALVVCNIFGLNCISATKCDFHIFNFLLSMLQYNSPPFKFIVQKKSLGLKWRLTSEASGIVRHWKQHPGLHAPLVWSNRAAPVFLESLQKVFGLNWAQPGLSIYLALAEQVWKLRDGRQVSGCDPNLCWSSGLALWRSEGISEGRKNLSLYLLQTIANFRNKSGKYQSYMPSLFCFCLSFKSKMDVNVKLSNRNSVSE